MPEAFAHFKSSLFWNAQGKQQGTLEQNVCNYGQQQYSLQKQTHAYYYIFIGLI